MALKTNMWAGRVAEINKPLKFLKKRYSQKAILARNLAPFSKKIEAVVKSKNWQTRLFRNTLKTYGTKTLPQISKHGRFSKQQYALRLAKRVFFKCRKSPFRFHFERAATHMRQVYFMVRQKYVLQAASTTWKWGGGARTSAGYKAFIWLWVSTSNLSRQHTNFLKKPTAHAVVRNSNHLVQYFKKLRTPFRVFTSTNALSKVQNLISFYRYAYRDFFPFEVFEGSLEARELSWFRNFWRTKIKLNRQLKKRKFIFRSTYWRRRGNRAFRIQTTTKLWVRESVASLALSVSQKKLLLQKYSRINIKFKLKSYITKLWRVSLRLKFERYFFNQVGQPVYVWFHSIWAIYFKRQRIWKKIQFKAIRRWSRFKHQQQRGALNLRFTLLLILYKTLGIFGLISGSLHCFMHVVCLLFKKSRQHWAVIRLLKALLRRCRRRIKTLVAFYLSISGKTGSQRTNKKVFKLGARLKLLDLSLRIESLSTCAHTRWGVFGIHVWAQFKRHFRHSRKGNVFKLKRTPRLLTYQKNIDANLKIQKRSMENKLRWTQKPKEIYDPLKFPIKF